MHRPGKLASLTQANVYFSSHETVLSGSFGRVGSALYSSYGTGSMSCYFDTGTTDFLPERGKLYLLSERE